MSPQLQRGLALASIPAACAAAYANALRSPFVFLDVSAIADNATIRRLWPIWDVLRPPLTRGVTVEGRPVLNLSLALNYALSGTHVWSYHLFNLIIHALAALTLYGIVRRTLKRDGLALAVALLWAVHPLQTESVTYVVQRAESLMGLFYLITLYCFIRGVQPSFAPHGGGATAGEKPGGRRLSVWLVFSVFACLFGMGTKEVMVSAPVLVLLYDRTWIAGSFAAALRSRWRYYLALALTWAPLIWLVAGTGGNRGGTSGFGLGVSWGTYVLTQFPAIAHYLRLAVWPFPQVFYYAVTWISAAAAAPTMILILALAVATFVAALQRSGWGFWGTWFFAILAPTSLVPGISQTIAEHRMYLALAPALVVVVMAIDALRTRLRGRAFVVTALVLAGIALTAVRNRIYASEVALWTDTVGKVATNPYTQNNFGIALVRAGRRGDAIAAFRRAIALDPSYAEAYDNLGLALAGQHDFRGAEEDYRRALQLRPDYAEGHANLGVTLADLGHYPEAVGQFQEALRLRPNYLEARNDLAVALIRSGRVPDAIREYEQVLASSPATAEVHFNLANALAAEGRWREAAEHYGLAVALDPSSADAHSNYGAALATLGRQDEAVAQYRAALRITPNDPDVHYNLALALQALGRTQEATQENDAAAHLRLQRGSQ